MNEIERHNRLVMLKRVKNYWLKGVLEESLHGGELIDLGLAYRPSALAESLEPEWQQSAEYDIPLPVGTKISTVFNAAGGELLILGEPGAGKTTMLLELVSDLLAYAEGDEERPIPVVFSLANWSNKQPLEEWILDELGNNYEVPHQLGRVWINNQGFVPLLDGLDEVETEQRTACADAINNFRQKFPGVWMLVTTRSTDYHALTTRLNLDKAIVLQPLSIEQIDTYLASRGPRLAGLRAALYEDATLRELANSPLMLSIMTLAYYRLPPDVALALGDHADGRSLLFDVYVERMSRYRSGDKEFNPQDTIHWLSWLAYEMNHQNRTMFFLENMQPRWLPADKGRQFESRTKMLILLLFAACGLLAGLISFPAFGFVGIGAGTISGLLIGLIPILSSRLLISNRIDWQRIETVETLDWSWQWAWLGMGAGAVFGLGAGLLVTWLDNVAGSSSGTPWWLLLALFMGLALVLDKALSRSEVKIRTTPGLGIQRSRQNGFVVGVASIVGAAIFVSLALAAGNILGLSFSWAATLPWVAGGALFLGLTAGLAYGGLAALQYSRLRTQLHDLDLIPGEYVHFLDYAAERSLLRKVGGGYTFMHALLLDYFVKRHATDQERAPEFSKSPA